LRSKDPISCEKYRGDIEGERGKRVFDCLFKMLNKYFLSGRGGNCHVAAGRKKKVVPFARRQQQKNGKCSQEKRKSNRNGAKATCVTGRQILVLFIHVVN